MAFSVEQTFHERMTKLVFSPITNNAAFFFCDVSSTVSVFVEQLQPAASEDPVELCSTFVVSLICLCFNALSSESVNVFSCCDNGERCVDEGRPPGKTYHWRKHSVSNV